MKLIAKLIIIIAIFLAGYYVGTQQLLPEIIPTGLLQPGPESQKSLSLMLDFGDGRIKTFGYGGEVSQVTVFDFLKQISDSENLTLDYQDYGGELGAFIKAIDGQANDTRSGKFWQFWVNNEYAQVGASQYQLKQGDVIEWKYVAGQVE